MPGGGVAYIHAARVLRKFKIYKDGEGDADEQIGVNLMRRALEEQLRLIVQNAGTDGAAERGVNRWLDAHHRGGDFRVS